MKRGLRVGNFLPSTFYFLQFIYVLNFVGDDGGEDVVELHAVGAADDVGEEVSVDVGEVEVVGVVVVGGQREVADVAHVDGGGVVLSRTTSTFAISLILLRVVSFCAIMPVQRHTESAIRRSLFIAKN